MFLDPVTISLLFGVGTLVIERIYSLIRHVKHSDCVHGRVFNVDFTSPNSSTISNRCKNDVPPSDIAFPLPDVHVESIKSDSIPIPESKTDLSSL